MGKNWAIAVGINQYDNLQPLNYAKRDAEEMVAWFENEANFDEVFLFTEDSDPIERTNPPISTTPTFGHLRRFLRAQFENIEPPLLKPEDNLWFFFAGHGRRHRDRDYLMLSDSDPGDVEHTALSVEYVTQRLRRSGADNVVLLLDACRDKGSRGGLGIGEEKHQGVITFYACTANQLSWEIDELQHGSFTHTLLEGLRLQKEVNCATVERLDQYLRYRVPQLNKRYGKKAQNPYLKAEPPYKLYFILLEQSATLKDVEPLKLQAFRTENENLSLAKQLWIRVLAASRGDLDAIDAIERIALKQKLSSLKEKSSISIPEKERGERSAKLDIELKTCTFQVATIEIQETCTFEFYVATLERQFSQSEVEEVKWGLNCRKQQRTAIIEVLESDVELELMKIPGGNFMMGAPESLDRERHQHKVTVPSFYIGHYTITQAQWRVVAGWERVERELNSDPSRFKEEYEGIDRWTRPVEQVSWEDAKEFCDRLSQKTGREYR